jgi:hypothetical protein
MLVGPRGLQTHEHSDHSGSATRNFKSATPACKKPQMPLRLTGHPTVIVPMIPRLWSMLIIMPTAHVVLTNVEAFAVTAEFKK